MPTYRHRRNQGSQAGTRRQEPSRYTDCDCRYSNSVRNRVKARHGNNSTGCETLKRPNRLVCVRSHRTRHRADRRRWGPYCHPAVEAFPNDVSTLSAATIGARLAIHGNVELAGTVLATDSVSVRVSHFKSVQYALSAMDAVLDTVLPSIQPIFHRKVIILDFGLNAVLEKVPH